MFMGTILQLAILLNSYIVHFDILENVQKTSPEIPVDGKPFMIQLHL